MLKIVLTIYFLLGAVSPFLFSKTYTSITKLRQKTDWLNNGYIHHVDYEEWKRAALFWSAVSLLYILFFCSFITISLHIL